MRKGQRKRSDSRSRNSRPELEEFFESVHERMKNLAIAQKSYRARNDKELSVQPGEFFEVLDDAGSWWCLRAPSGRTGHVPKTHLELVPNPSIRDSDRYNDQNVDPIVVKVPVIVKASVKHQEIEEQVKSKPPTPQPPSQANANQSAVSQQPISLTPPPPVQLQQQQYPEPRQEIPSSVTAPSEPKIGPSSNYPAPPPQSIFPPVRYGERQPYQTVIKEVIREVPPYRHYRRNKSRYQSKRDVSPQYSVASGSTSSSSSSSGVASWISDGAQHRGSSRNRRSKSQLQTHRSSRRSVAQLSKAETSPPPPHHCCHGGKDCRHRSVCCYSSKGSRARSTITDVSQRGPSKKNSHQSSQQDQQPQQPQQPMIILLEAPKQEPAQPEVVEGQTAEDYYDPNNQPQISIVLPPNAQLGPAMSAYTPMQTVLQQQPQYAQAPTYYNWTPQYYQSYT
nr:epidermal growth factor receptor kinase [Hymenolepis microstoma]